MAYDTALRIFAQRRAAGLARVGAQKCNVYKMASKSCRLLNESFLLGLSQSRLSLNCCPRRIFTRLSSNGRWNTFQCVRSRSRALPCALVLDHNTKIIADGKRSKITLSTSKDSWTQTIKSIESYLKQKEIKYNHGHTSIIAQCPFCALSKAQGGHGTAMTLFVNKTTGSHVCNSCGTSGTWNEFKVGDCDHSSTLSL